MVLLRLAFWGLDEEEARGAKTSPKLEALFSGLGFSPLAAGFISEAVVKYWVDLLPKKRGRPWPRRRLIEGHARRLAGIKEELRARGERGNVHKKAMQLLQTEYEQWLREHPDAPAEMRRFDYDAIENYVRRSKRRSTK